MKVKSLSQVQLFATPWTVAYQAPLSMGFSRQEYWSGVPFQFSFTNQIIYFPSHYLILCLCLVHQPYLWSVACGVQEEGRGPVMTTNIITTDQYTTQCVAITLSKTALLLEEKFLTWLMVYESQTA